MKKILGSYPEQQVVITSTLALFVFGLFTLCLLHAQQCLKTMQEHVKIHIYLQKSIQPTQKLHLVQSLEKHSYLISTSLQFITKEEVSQQFLRDTGEDFLRILKENPFYDSYMINVKLRYQKREHLKKLQQDILSLPGVSETIHNDLLWKDLPRITNRLQWIIGFIALILLVIVTVLMNRTIRLALYTQRFLIRTMQLVGATPSFIMRPFLQHALFTGLLSGLLANITLLFFLYTASHKNVSLWQLQQPFKIFLSLLLTQVTSLIIACFSTYQTLKKYLRLNLNQLYTS